MSKAPVTAKTQPESDDSSNWQTYFVPEYGVSVKARSLDEAVKKARDQAKRQRRVGDG